MKNIKRVTSAYKRQRFNDTIRIKNENDLLPTIDEPYLENDDIITSEHVQNCNEKEYSSGEESYESSEQSNSDCSNIDETVIECDEPSKEVDKSKNAKQVSNDRPLTESFNYLLVDETFSIKEYSNQMLKNKMNLNTLGNNFDKIALFRDDIYDNNVTKISMYPSINDFTKTFTGA